ncbi:MAG: HPr family phosphocarrier protein [Halothiobacillaceae bacterium]
MTKNLKIINRRGLHARAAAKFATLAGQFSADIAVEFRGRRVNGKSIMGLMMLAATQHSEIEVHADGPDAEEALSALQVLVDNRFEEDA